MNATEFTANYFKVHNQAVEIAELKAELERAKNAHRRRTTQLYAERELAAERQARLQRRLDFYKSKFKLLAFGQS